jgi:4-diphosphocytidyl-2-C-methyl-D-erythritol kinase
VSLSTVNGASASESAAASGNKDGPIFASDRAMQTERASAKINLFLHIGERRQDGFHDLQSLALFPSVGDVLRAVPAPQLDLIIEGPFAAGLQGDVDNLVLRAARALQSRARATEASDIWGAALTLEKNLPVASGIGGGSADAAAALRLLKRLWQIELNEGALIEIAATLGSDVPVCLASVAAYMEGRGEILHPIVAVPRLALLLVNPGVSVATKDVFAALQRRSGAAKALPHSGFSDCAELLRFLETTTNDLEAPARSIQPVIGEVLSAMAALPGALFSRMSGSGATCFAIFPDDDSCVRAAAKLQKAAPGWWVAPAFVPEQSQVEKEPVQWQDIGPTDDGL